MGYIGSIYVHIICAAFWIGGMLFLPLVLLPGIKNHPDRKLLLYKTGIQFRLYGWLALAGLFVTGVMNMYYRGLPLSWEFITGSDYGELLSIKLGLFVFMLLLGAFHDFYIGKKAINSKHLSEKTNTLLIARWSGRLNLLLALSIAFIGVALSKGGF